MFEETGKEEKELEGAKELDETEAGAGGDDEKREGDGEKREGAEAGENRVNVGADEERDAGEEE